MQTDRLLLRKLTIDDLNCLNTFFGDAEATKYLQGIKSPDETKVWLSLVLQSYEQDGFGPLAILSKKENQFIGYCRLYRQNDVDGKDEIEILYGPINRCWGKGYATEAAKRIYSFGKSELGIRRFVSLIVPENIRSLRVAHKLCMGFEKECRMWNRKHHLYSIECE